MRIASWGPRGQERPGLLVGEVLVDLNGADGGLPADAGDLFAGWERLQNRLRKLAGSLDSVPADATATVRLTVHDATGRLVRTLVNRVQGLGAYSVSWDGNDERSRPVASGVYFHHLQWNGRSETRRAVLLR